MPRLPVRLALALSVAASTLLVPAATVPASAARAAVQSFTDVPTTYWDYTAIQYVAVTNTWMQDYGTTTFLPTTNEYRKYAARALVEAYAPDEPIDPTITFPDLPSDDPFYPYANVAVKLGWIPVYKSGTWGPDAVFSVRGWDKALIQAMGVFTSQIAGLQNLKETNGTPYVVSDSFPYMQLSHYVDLHFNHDDETLDKQPTSYITRDEAAYELWKAETIQQWQIDQTTKFSTIVLMGIKSSEYYKHQLTQEGINQVGEPYIYGGEWYKTSPGSYCCGYQPQGGFDCSGFAWWVLKKYEGGYDAYDYRSQVYNGWSILDRTSSYMALNTKVQKTYDQLKVGDLMFFATGGGTQWSDVDHVGVYIGSGWMIHSSGSTDGPVLEWVGDGFYHDTFLWGRNIIAGTSPSQGSKHALENYATAGDDH